MFKPIKLILTTATVVAATASSVAYARLNLNPSGSSFATVPGPTAVVPSVQGTQSSSARGFQWGDAGIGAASVLVLLSIGSGAVLVRQRRAHHPLTS
jgi:hypothetical protein